MSRMVGIRDSLNSAPGRRRLQAQAVWSGGSAALRSSAAPGSAIAHAHSSGNADGTCPFDASLLDEQCGESPVMALRIAIGIFAALRAALIYGEAAGLTTQPLDLSRIRRARSVVTALGSARSPSALVGTSSKA